MAEEFTRCCYGATSARACGPGTARRAAPVGRVHWAGSESSDVWNGYMAPSARGAAPPPGILANT
jgi:monoamine oxidase